jgi:hypothetical protein
MDRKCCAMADLDLDGHTKEEAIAAVPQPETPAKNQFWAGVSIGLDFESETLSRPLQS